MTDVLIHKSDTFVHKVYKITRNFPKSELFGITSQVRRSSLSIVLNLIEGFARQSKKEYIRFMEISYGSLKETKYLLHFSYKEDFITKDEYNELIGLAEELGKIIWVKMKKLKI